MDSSVNGNHAQDDGTRKLVPGNRTRDLERVMDATAIMPPPQDFGTLQTQVEQVRAATAAPFATILRRLLFMWLRIYVYEAKRSKEQRVNVSIPIPIPLVGVAFRNRLAWNQALKAVARAHDDGDDPRMLARYVESCMAFEFVRVEEENADKKELVVIGLD